MRRLVLVWALVAGCFGGPPRDPWFVALEAFEDARSASPDYTSEPYDEVLDRLKDVPPEHPHHLEALALERVLRSERAVVERTGLELVPGPPIEVETQLIETDVSTATVTAEP